MKEPKRYLITAALPYANGPVHIGHLAGCYLPADIYVRYLRAQKRDVKFIGGSDEHGVPITIRAMKEGITPQQVVDKFHALIKESMTQMGISFDIYSRTSNAVHHETASAFFKKMYDALKEQGILVTYCAKGVVKRTMKEVGFLVETIPGPPGKREMTRATKQLI